PLLQTVSYYMLPNNHVYFNFLNNLLFSWWGNEVVTGRLISITAYTGVLLCAWYWLQRLIPNKPLAFAALLPVALQFTVWGMAAQARGYEGQLCCFWVGFTALFLYLQQPREWLLRLHLLASIFGFLLVPTYLSCYAAQVLFFFCVMAYNRQWSWRFFIYQWLAGGIVFLFYLPAFCFSGVPAFTENRYVIPVYTTWLDFLPNFFGTLKYFINCCFSMLCGEDRAINFVLFFLPFILFFSHRKERRMAAFGFTIVWLVYIVLTLNMGRNPNNRNMIMHYSITMACVVYAFYAMMEKAASLLKTGKWRRVFLYVFFVAPVLAYCGHLVVTNRRDISFMLYYNDVNEINKNLVASMTLIPREATIGFSNEAFYMYYHFTKNKYKTVKCPDGTETYFIKQKDDEMPAAEVGKYDKVNEIYQGYEFYKHK
ncbi:MAG: hypothetical protein H7257_13485, partial [Taibaiella sp.]|nr:hypothetical protein [Taibaiella sp.]